MKATRTRCPGSRTGTGSSVGTMSQCPCTVAERCGSAECSSQIDSAACEGATTWNGTASNSARICSRWAGRRAPYTQTRQAMLSGGGAWQ